MRSRGPTPTDLTHTTRRRKLRNSATFVERILWYSLRGSQLDGRKFTRQKGIGPYIVDFYCAEEKLVIELDGPVHDLLDVKEYDQKREEWLISQGLLILRFTNEEIYQNADPAIARVRAIWSGKEREQPRRPDSRSRAARQGKRERNSTPQPPPLSRGGGA